jgi:hypothetical protein
VRAPTLGTPDPAGIWKQGESPPTPKIRKNSIKIRKKIKNCFKNQNDETAAI